MSLTLADVKRIANLAQLDMSDAHAETTLAELNGIFALAEQMQAVFSAVLEPAHRALVERPVTKFEARGRRLGHPIRELFFRKGRP